MRKKVVDFSNVNIQRRKLSQSWIRIHGQYQSQMGGQGQILSFSQFPITVPLMFKLLDKLMLMDALTDIERHTQKKKLHLTMRPMNLRIFQRVACMLQEIIWYHNCNWIITECLNAIAISLWLILDMFIPQWWFHGCERLLGQTPVAQQPSHNLLRPPHSWLS